MKTAIIGSRSFTNYHIFCEKIQNIDVDITEIISGGAIGADSLAARYATEKGIKLTILKPDWKTKGKSAAMLRNKDIVNASELVIAFWNGSSPGTKHALSYAKSKHIPVIIIDI
jgi:predicted Rossmann fold nucleotide-binding protein DprA/Smf involved in DNA uptake